MFDCYVNGRMAFVLLKGDTLKIKRILETEATKNLDVGYCWGNYPNVLGLQVFDLKM